MFLRNRLPPGQVWDDCLMLRTNVGVDVGGYIVVSGYEPAAVDVQHDGPARGTGGGRVDVDAISAVRAVLEGLLDLDVVAVLLVLGGLQRFKGLGQSRRHVRAPAVAESGQCCVDGIHDSGLLGTGRR